MSKTLINAIDMVICLLKSKMKKNKKEIAFVWANDWPRSFNILGRKMLFTNYLEKIASLILCFCKCLRYVYKIQNRALFHRICVPCIIVCVLKFQIKMYKSIGLERAERKTERRKDRLRLTHPFILIRLESTVAKRL